MKKIGYFKFFFLVIIAFLYSGFIFPAYSAEVVELSGKWKLIESKNEKMPEDANIWKEVDVPGYITGNEYQFAWFKKDFTISHTNIPGERVFIKCEGVRWKSDVFINDKLAGSHTGGFEGFEFDITDSIKWGELNTCLVKVGNFSSICDVKTRRLLYPPAWHRDAKLHGIWGDVNILIRPSVFSKNVSVFTSVKKKTISAAVEVVNKSGKNIDVNLLFRVMDGADEKMSFKSPPVTFMPGEQKLLRGAGTWDALRLWWPHDPYLYKLQTIIEIDGKEYDKTDTVFGFREFSIDGNQFSFNGKRIHLHGACFHIADVYDHLEPQSSQRTFNLLKYANVNCVRLMDQPWPQHWYETADKMGILVIADTAITPDASQMITDERYWNNAREHVRSLVKDKINHPSIIIWDITSEIDSLLLNNKMERSELESRVIALKHEAKIIDPLRPVMNEGAQTFGDGDIENIHYPREYVYDLNMGGSHYQYPNISYWFVQNKGGSLRKDPTKPYFIGETLWEPSRTPDGDSIFVGDEGYKDFIRYKTIAKAKAWLMQLKAYRYNEIPAVTPWNLFETKPWGNGWSEKHIPSKNELVEACRTAFSPIAAFVKEYGSRFFAGSDFSREVTIFNDTLEDKEFAINSELELDGKKIWSSKRKSFIEAGGKDFILLAARLPEVKERTKLKLLINVSDKKGEVLFSDSYDYSILPVLSLKNVISGKVAVYDPYNSLSFLRGADFKSLDQPGANIDDDIKLIIAGEKAFSPGLKNQPQMPNNIIDFVRRGGSAIVMKQDSLPQGLFPLSITGHSPTICYIRAPGHPVFNEMEEGDFSFWGKNNIVATNCFSKPEKAGARALIDSGGEGGLLYSPLVEVFIGKGKILFCQMNIALKINDEPAAGMIFTNMVKYCLEEKKNDIGEVRGVLLSGNDDFKGRLESVGFPIDDCRKKEISKEKGFAYKRIFIFNDFDAAAANRFREIKPMIEAGDALYLHGLTPQGFKLAQDMFLAGFEMAKPKRNPPFLKNNVLKNNAPLTWGMSNQELYWIDDKPAPGLAPSPLRGNIIENQIYSEARDSAIMTPSGLLEIPLGKGKIVIDQLTWDRLPQNSPAWRNAKRYLSVLFTNLAPSF
ncbi:MAG: hypothetical protein HZA77_10105 [Candidatus Schekmanbacteria bacterium]|nr:hypothetical protein [Candidatus Schekmanbacteria bacterium]